MILLLCTFLLLLFSLLLFRGKAKGLIAGYRTLSEEERQKYDEKYLYRYAGLICLACSITLGTMAVLAPLVERKLISETCMSAVVTIILCILVLTVVITGFQSRNKK